MQYKIKEVSKILNIPIDSLRYYEKLGVITPKIDEKNHYRYYDAWDINYLLEYLYYRRMDYSSQEILEFIHMATISDQINKVGEKLAYYQERRDYYDHLGRRNQRFLGSLENIPKDLNSIQILPCGDYRCLVYRKNYRFNQKSEMNQILSQWMEYYPLVENLVIIRKETIEQRQDNQYEWSFAISERDFQRTNLSENEFVQNIPSVLCVRTLVDAGEQGMFHYQLIDHVMKFIQDHKFALAGDPFGILLTRAHDENGFHRYIEFFIPIQI